jgi:hypothetical protein
MTPLAYLKLILGAGVAFLLFFGGMSCGRASSVQLVAAKDRALEAAGRSLKASADVLDLVNQRAAESKVEAQAQAVRAQQAVQAAAVDKADYQARIGNITEALEKAKRQPTCRAQLEQPLCVDLH